MDVRSSRPFVAYARSIALGRQAFHDPRSKRCHGAKETVARTTIGRFAPRRAANCKSPEYERNQVDTANQNRSGEFCDPDVNSSHFETAKLARRLITAPDGESKNRKQSGVYLITKCFLGNNLCDFCAGLKLQSSMQFRRSKIGRRRAGTLLANSFDQDSPNRVGAHHCNYPCYQDLPAEERSERRYTPCIMLTLYHVDCGNRRFPL